MNVNISAGRIRDAIVTLGPEKAVPFIQILLPDISQARAQMMAKYPWEMRVNGTTLWMPDSWDEICEVAK